MVQGFHGQNQKRSRLSGDGYQTPERRDGSQHESRALIADCAVGDPGSFMLFKMQCLTHTQKRMKTAFYIFP